MWYEAGRSFSKIKESLGVSDVTLWNWSQRYLWTDRADKRDMQIACKVEAEAISRRAKMIEDQRRIGQAMRNAGAQYLVDNGKKAAKSAKDAVSLIGKGFELERQAEGVPDYVVQILNASENELRDQYADLLRSAAALGVDAGDGEVKRLES